MKLVFILGDAAVGKMTVGQELMKITDLRLFHNHMTIEPVLEIMGHFDGQLISDMRELIFRRFAALTSLTRRMTRPVSSSTAPAI